ncbi:MAG TPA: hypothetical protein VEW70_10350, partial [Burkholderiales bacterium]|nr:hypothetical protein [Burkholderiales bacterium]
INFTIRAIRSGFVSVICLHSVVRKLPRPANQRGMSMKTGLALVVALAAFWNAGASHAQGFKFSQEDNTAKAKEEARQQAITERLSTPCMEQLKDKKIMLIIGEQQIGGGILANQDNKVRTFRSSISGCARSGSRRTRRKKSRSRSHRRRSTPISKATLMPRCLPRAGSARISCCAG